MKPTPNLDRISPLSADAPGSDQWWAKITPSKIPAILGLSPWQSREECFDRMRAARGIVIAKDGVWDPAAGTHEPQPLSEKPQHWVWGHCAEVSLAEYWLVAHGRPRSRLSALYRREDGTHTRGVTLVNRDIDFPHQVDLDALDYEGPEDDGRILECKTGVTTSQLEAILWQVHGEMLLTGIPQASLISFITDGIGVPVVTDHTVDPGICGWLTRILAEWEAALTLGDATPPKPPQIPWRLGWTSTGITLTPKEN